MGCPFEPSRRFLLTGLGAVIAAPAVRAQARELVIPISSTSFATAQVRAADVLGCYAKHGLNVKFPMMDTGSNLTAALLSGSAPIILGGSGEQVAAWARGQEVLTLVNVYWGLAATIVLAKEVAERTGVSPTAPVADRLKALDGLTIASPSATSNYTNSFKGAAEEVGSKIRYTYMSQPAMVAALESGVIQGYTAGAPLWGSQVARGRAVIWLSGPRGDLKKQHSPASTTAFQAMRSVAERDRDLIRRVVDSYRSFSNILSNTPAEVRGALGKLYPQVEPETMDVLFKAEGAAWKMRDITPDDMRQEIAFMVSSGASLPGVSNIDPAAMIYAPPN